MIDEKFLKPYDPAATEGEMYQRWEASGFFNPETCVEKGVTKTDAPTFSIVLPPPNVTGTLHTGHAVMLALEDIVVRYHRMKGDRTLWLPGTDSAAIATQSKVEKELQKEGSSRHDLGRDEFLKRVNAFALQSQSTILNQTRRMGSSLDWSRLAYTLDEPRYRAVMTAFVRMYEAGLIYRGNRIVNWDPKGQTVISDDEIVYEERPAKLYTFKYSKDFPIAISTTRPETKVGDVAVAVHPDDERYAAYVGNEYDVVFCDVPVHIKVIADKSVEKEFGTGALGVTPAHSHIDWEIADRHDLPRPQVINEYAKMTVEGRLNGMKTTEARSAVVAWLSEEGLLEKEEDITQNISTAERTGAVIEPLPKLQWWVAVNKPFVLAQSKIPGIASGSETTLREVMRKSVESGSVTIMPDRFEKTYYHWIDNLRDWCISRQIWFGHRIPVWYRGEEMYVGTQAPEGDGWEQDSDTLDTWFSSGLWTFSTLGWPEHTPELATYHPTSLLETGYDILFFWVARMILMSGFLLGEVPFTNVYLHGLVRDEKGRKMSKSLGNIVDPLSFIEKYGADALRMALVVGVGPGNDNNLAESKVKAYKLFANKLWNISRFVFENASDAPMDVVETTADAARREELSALTSEITRDIEAYRFYMAGEKLYHYVWHTFADEILEESKAILKGEDIPAVASRKRLLLDILKTSLVLLHPFMPYITEAIWEHVPNNGDTLLMVSPWP